MYTREGRKGKGYRRSRKAKAKHDRTPFKLNYDVGFFVIG